MCNDLHIPTDIILLLSFSNICLDTNSVQLEDTYYNEETEEHKRA